MFRIISAVASLLAVASAQSVVIGSPANGISVHSGANITVMVSRPNSLTGSTEVSLVFGMQSCVSGLCEHTAPTDYLGTLLLHTGSYNPQYAAHAPGWQPPHQNYTMTVPTYLTKGAARLSVTHYSLVGASYEALFETVTTNITIV